jgi:hypothetical protein
MKIYLILALLCLLCIVQLYDNRATPASSAHVAALLGGTQCYYPTPAQCANALAAQECVDWCWWWDLHTQDPEDPAWGYHGTYFCPEGAEYQISVETLSTTFKTEDTQDLGWYGDDEKATPEDCNVKLACRCGFEYAPRHPSFSGYYPLCDTYGPPLAVPTGTFREVTGNRDCNPQGTGG